MGYIRHDAVIAIIRDFDGQLATVKKKITALKRKWPEDLPDCILGPVSGVNGTYTYFFSPDGSKEGWATSDLGDEMRDKFISIMKKTKHPDIVHLRMGGDDRETTVVYSTDGESKERG